MQLPEDPVSDSSEGGESGASPDKVWETVVAAMLDVSDLPAADYRLDLRLQEDFDLHPIALFAVVSRIEDDLKVKLKDSEVTECQTLADLVALVKSA